MSSNQSPRPDRDQGTVPETTRVIFRSFTEYGTATDPDGVIALFPDVAEGRGSVLSYMHHGQHSGASVDLVRTLYVTTPSQRAPLVRELESIGYALEVDTVTPGRLPRPHVGDREALAPYADFRSLQRNGDARDAVVARVPFANRSHTLTGRLFHVPVGATLERVTGGRAVGDNNDTVAHIRITPPPATGAATQILPTGALPTEHVAALEGALVGLSRDPDRSHLYVAYSFATPILWADATPGTPEHVPPVRYSMTTTKHQQNVADRFHGGEDTARVGRGRTPFGTGWQTYSRTR